MRTVTKTKIWSTVGALALLTACGGGGGDDGGIDSRSGDGGAAKPPVANPPVANPPPVVNPPVNNEVAKAFADGVHLLWGSSFILNNVPQVFVSRGYIDASGFSGTTKIAGMVTSPETPPSLLWAVEDEFWSGTESRDCRPKLAFDGTVEALVSCEDASLSGVRWSLQLNREDVAGKRVADYVRTPGGAALTGTWAHPDTLFPPGSVAYTSVFEAREDIVRPSSLSFDQPAGAGWCYRVDGQSGRLGVLLNADKTLSIFEMPTSVCRFEGLSAMASGTWQEVSLDGRTAYQVDYPESVRSDTRWASLFSAAYEPAGRIGNLLMKESAAATTWTLVVSVKKGERFVGLQPHFNSTALPALKQLAGLQ